MERYEVRLCPAAVRDLEELVRRLDRLSPPAALRSYDFIAEQMRSLALMPERCPRPRDLALRARGYRCLRAWCFSSSRAGRCRSAASCTKSRNMPPCSSGFGNIRGAFSVQAV